MKSKIVLILTTLSLMLTACGIVRSTSSIQKAKHQRENSLNKIISEYGKKDIVAVDDYGYRTLKQDAAEGVLPFNKRRAAYYFYKADFYLRKACDFRSRSMYDVAEYLAKKSMKLLLMSDQVLNDNNTTNSSQVKPLDSTSKEGENEGYKNMQSKNEQYTRIAPETEGDAK